MYSKIILLALGCFLCLSLTAQQGWAPEQSPAITAVKRAPKDNLLLVQPNPGNGIYQVAYKSETKGQLTLAVSDATGKYVYLKSIRDFTGELKETIDLTVNPKGIYIFQVESDEHRDLKKVIYQ